mmetsp:Transcript_19062/g.41115  ORF Transcript_19062/g.41115 Transcript_19062/m.41115 type:complete len:202 (-) Transcript_19062:418-1023(-)
MYQPTGEVRKRSMHPKGQLQAVIPPAQPIPDSCRRSAVDPAQIHGLRPGRRPSRLEPRRRLLRGLEKSRLLPVLVLRIRVYRRSVVGLAVHPILNCHEIGVICVDFEFHLTTQLHPIELPLQQRRQWWRPGVAVVRLAGKGQRGSAPVHCHVRVPGAKQQAGRTRIVNSLGKLVLQDVLVVHLVHSAGCSLQVLRLLSPLH